MERREFVRTAMGAAALSAASASRVLGANDRINIGLIGCGGRGSLDTRLIRGTKEDVSQRSAEDQARLSMDRNVAVTALCDVNKQKIDRAKSWAPEAKAYHDFRDMLEDKDLNAVVIATQDQWHVPMAVLAADAGKHIYLEKPVMYTIKEGQAVIDAVRRNRVLCQVGSQHRSAAHIAEAAEIVQSGKIGEVAFVRVWNNLNPSTQKPSANAPAPDWLDWDAWLGPAPWVDYNPDRLGYRNFMEYTNGLITDYGMHRIDSVHQIMNEDTPRTVSSSWKIVRKGKTGTLPDIHQATYEYESFIMSYECCTMNSHGLGGRTAGMSYYGASGPEDRPHGMAFYGTKAALFVDRLGMELYSEATPESRGGGKWEPIMKKMAMNEPEPTAIHCQRFVENLRANKEPFANVERGVKSTIAPVLGNVAAKADAKLHWDGDKVAFKNNKDADKLLFREYRKPYNYVKIEV